MPISQSASVIQAFLALYLSRLGAEALSSFYTVSVYQYFCLLEHASLASSEIWAFVPE